MTICEKNKVNNDLWYQLIIHIKVSWILKFLPMGSNSFNLLCQHAIWKFLYLKCLCKKIPILLNIIHHIRFWRFFLDCCEKSILWNRNYTFPITVVKGLHPIIFVSNIFPNSHLIQKCIHNQQLFQNSCWICIHFWIKWELRKIFDTKMIDWSPFNQNHTKWPQQTPNFKVGNEVIWSQ